MLLFSVIFSVNCVTIFNHKHDDTIMIKKHTLIEVFSLFREKFF